jgi:hypothetical protein
VCEYSKGTGGPDTLAPNGGATQPLGHDPSAATVAARCRSPLRASAGCIAGRLAADPSSAQALHAGTAAAVDCTDGRWTCGSAPRGSRGRTERTCHAGTLHDSATAARARSGGRAVLPTRASSGPDSAVVARARSAGRAVQRSRCHWCALPGEFPELTTERTSQFAASRAAVVFPAPTRHEPAGGHSGPAVRPYTGRAHAREPFASPVIPRRLRSRRPCSRFRAFCR